MFLHITQATPVGNFRVDVTFNDGKRGIADLSEVVQHGAYLLNYPIP